MSSFSASVRVDDGMLHTSRPVTAPEPVADLIDQLVYNMTSGAADGGVTSIELVVETSDESQTPIADSTTGTSSQPLAAAGDVDDDMLEPSGSQA